MFAANHRHMPYVPIWYTLLLFKRAYMRIYDFMSSIHTVYVLVPDNKWNSRAYTCVVDSQTAISPGCCWLESWEWLRKGWKVWTWSWERLKKNVFWRPACKKTICRPAAKHGCSSVLQAPRSSSLKFFKLKVLQAPSSSRSKFFKIQVFSEVPSSSSSANITRV